MLIDDPPRPWRRWSPRGLSSTFALADGLSHSEHEALVAALGAELAERIVPAERLAVGWLETRSPAEPSWMTSAHAGSTAGRSGSS